MFGSEFKLIGYHWWLLRHYASEEWIPEKVFTILGVPLTTVFFSVIGPFESKKEAEEVSKGIKSGKYKLVKIR